MSPDAVEGKELEGDPEGLLDGLVLPLADSSRSMCHSTAMPILMNQKNREKEVRALADMAVGCMVRGGTGMSRTLEGFLGRNKNYDAPRACLMLAATASSACSELEDCKRASTTLAEIDQITEKILCAMRCLLCIAVTRDCMPTALSLLNATIPDELRCRGRKGESTEEAYRPPLSLSKAIVTMIIASAPHSAGCLLNLKEDTPTRYWQSLDRQTQLALSMISVGYDYDYPLLREVEVRTWVL